MLRGEKDSQQEATYRIEVKLSQDYFYPSVVYFYMEQHRVSAIMQKFSLKHKISILTFAIATTLIGLDFNMAVKPATAIDTEGALCTRVVSTVDKTIKDNPTEENVIAALENVSQLFPVKDRSKVDSFLEQYANELSHILVEEGDPSLACTLLGVL